MAERALSKLLWCARLSWAYGFCHLSSSSQVRRARKRGLHGPESTEPRHPDPDSRPGGPRLCEFSQKVIHPQELMVLGFNNLEKEWERSRGALDPGNRAGMLAGRQAMLSHAFGVRMDEHPLRGRWSSEAWLLWESEQDSGADGQWHSVRSSHKAPLPPDIKPDRCLEFQH